MKTLLEQREREPHAAQAVELFCYQLRKPIGALTAVLGGLDTLVFTGGIGERAAPVRWEVCRDWRTWASTSTQRRMRAMRRSSPRRGALARCG